MSLCRLDDLPEGCARGFDPEGRGKNTMFVVRKGGDVFAYRDECPHYQWSTSLPWRTDEYLDRSANYIVCAAHGAEFEIDTGLCVRGPCIGESLARVPVRVTPDRHVVITNVGIAGQRTL